MAETICYECNTNTAQVQKIINGYNVLVCRPCYERPKFHFFGFLFCCVLGFGLGGIIYIVVFVKKNDAWRKCWFN